MNKAKLLEVKRLAQAAIDAIENAEGSTDEEFVQICALQAKDLLKDAAFITYGLVWPILL